MSPASVFDLREENMMLENLVMLAFVAVLMFCVALAFARHMECSAVSSGFFST